MTATPSADPAGVGVARHYAVFGGTLRSDIEFPDLPPSDATDADWTFELVDAPAPDDPGAREIGRHTVGKYEWRLLRSPAGLRLVFPPFGECAIRNAGRELTWYLGESRRLEFVRGATLGPVMALALHEAGTLCLHGAAVGFGDQAIALVAPKYHGKSTLALALVRGGATLLTDDTIAVDPDRGDVRPGVHSVRLWQDSADELATSGGAGEGRLLTGAKNTLVDLPPRVLQRDALPLRAIYVLVPVAAEAETPPAERTRVPELPAAVLLAHHTKLVDPLIGMQMAGEQLRWASALARRVPVYSLALVRDFARLSEVVEQIAAWHAPTATPSGSRG